MAPRSLLCISSPFYGHLRGFVCLGAYSVSRTIRAKDKTVANLLLHDAELQVHFVIHVTSETRAHSILSSFKDLDKSRLRFMTVGKNEDADRPGVLVLRMQQVILQGTKSWPRIDGAMVDGAFSPIATFLVESGVKAPIFLVFEGLVNADEQFMRAWAADDLNEVISEPGIKDVYAYEIEAVKINKLVDFWKASNVVWFSRRHHIITLFSGMVDTSMAQSAEERSRQAGTRLLPILAQYPPSSWSIATDAARTAQNEIGAYLQKVRAEKGDRSVIYISFGTLFLPQTEYIDALLKALSASSYSFIWVYAAVAINRQTRMASGLREKVEKAGGLAVEWCDQQTVIHDSTISWVLTHGGANTLSETLIAGKPMIVWPFNGDQVPNSSWLAEEADVAFEVFQPRSNLVGKKLRSHPDIEITATPEAVYDELRRVLAAFDSKDGQRKRQNAQRIRDVLHKEYKTKNAVYLQEILDLL